MEGERKGERVNSNSLPLFPFTPFPISRLTSYHSSSAHDRISDPVEGSIAFDHLPQDDRRRMLPTLLRCCARFCNEDEHYLASSKAYGDRGFQGLNDALDLFLEQPELGFVWMAHDERWRVRESA